MTWSLIVLNNETQEIGVAGASCTGYVAGIAGIVPGKGAIMAQAMSNMQAKAKGMELIAGAMAPRDIIARITDPEFDPSFAVQQYAVVTFPHHAVPAHFTGEGVGEFRGAITGDGFSVQGNILTSDTVLSAMRDAIVSARQSGLSIEETVMQGLEAGSIAGGDKRCGEQRATSAFLTVARPDDSAWHPYLNLVVHHVDPGSVNAVAFLRAEYERWQSIGKNNRSTHWFVRPPVSVS